MGIHDSPPSAKIFEQMIFFFKIWFKYLDTTHERGLRRALQARTYTFSQEKPPHIPSNPILSLVFFARVHLFHFLSFETGLGLGETTNLTVENGFVVTTK